MICSVHLTAHKFKNTAYWFSNNRASEMSNMHFFGNIWGWKINHNSAFLYFWVGKIQEKFIDFFFNEIIFDFNFEESLIIGLNGTDVVVFKKILRNFGCEFSNSFTSAASSLFFVFANVELFHGWGWDILALIFGSILQKHIWSKSKSLLKKTW